MDINDNSSLSEYAKPRNLSVTEVINGINQYNISLIYRYCQEYDEPQIKNACIQWMKAFLSFLGSYSTMANALDLETIKILLRGEDFIHINDGKHALFREYLKKHPLDEEALQEFNHLNQEVPEGESSIDNDTHVLFGFSKICTLESPTFTQHNCEWEICVEPSLLYGTALVGIFVKDLNPNNHIQCFNIEAIVQRITKNRTLETRKRGEISTEADSSLILGTIDLSNDGWRMGVEALWFPIIVHLKIIVAQKLVVNM